MKHIFLLFSLICASAQVLLALYQSEKQERKDSMTNATMQAARRHWWVSLVRGILALLFGIIALTDPLIVLLAFIYVFAVYAIIDGITTLIVSLQERSVLGAWWVLLLEGIAGIIFGILVLVWPVKTALALLYLVAIWALVTGVLKIASAFIVPESMKQRWGLGLAGLLSIIFGLILIIHPGAGLLTVLWLVGVFAIVFGLSLILYAFQLRSRMLAPTQQGAEAH